jgi:hypothetical protein
MDSFLASTRGVEVLQSHFITLFLFATPKISRNIISFIDSNPQIGRCGVHSVLSGRGEVAPASSGSTCELLAVATGLESCTVLSEESLRSARKQIPCRCHNQFFRPMLSVEVPLEETNSSSVLYCLRLN